MQEFPVISVVVVTYNSEKYVLETLESIRCQDYKGAIELIVSDDGSTDETLSICNEWILSNADRFSSCRILRTPHNLGICGNYNFALQYANGEWIKYIAGDDILLPEALTIYIQEANRTCDRAFCSGVISFNDDPELNVDTACYGEHYTMGDLLDSHDPEDQLRNLIFPPEERRGLIDGPTLFIHAQTLREMGGMDMRYPMLEDLPFAINWTKSGRHLGVIKLPLVKYREYSESVSQKYANAYFNRMAWNVFLDARIEYYLRHNNLLRAWDTKVTKSMVNNSGNSLKEKIIRRLFILSNPIFYKQVLKKAHNN